jgi:hypothetical protein
MIATLGTNIYRFNKVFKSYKKVPLYETHKSEVRGTATYCVRHEGM